jgi:hypothetical protein
MLNTFFFPDDRELVQRADLCRTIASEAVNPRVAWALKRLAEKYEYKSQVADFDAV